MDKNFEDMYRRLNTLDGNLVTYQEVDESFALDVKVDIGGGKWVKCVYRDEHHLILEFFIPEGEGYAKVYHDFLEEHRIIIGELFETGLKVTYGEQKLFTAAKGVLHGFKAKTDVLGYSYCYRP